MAISPSRLFSGGVALLLLAGTASLAADPMADPAAEGGWPEAIADNSFLIEEAYNQEPGVVQWIFGFQYDREGKLWTNTFTSEWPVPGKTHQLSLTLPFQLGGGSEDGLGDLLVNYRFQWRDGGERGWWVAPRLSVIAPSGAWREGRGNGAWGMQAGIPWSRRLSAHWACHFNIGATAYRQAKGLDREGLVFRANPWGLSAGGSLVFLATPTLNWLVEGVVSQDHPAVGPGRTDKVTQAIISPGFRRAVNTAKGQLVFGAAVPIGLTGDSPDPSFFLYLSWEGRVWSPK